MNRRFLLRPIFFSPVPNDTQNSLLFHVKRGHSREAIVAEVGRLLHPPTSARDRLGAPTYSSDIQCYRHPLFACLKQREKLLRAKDT